MIYSQQWTVFTVLLRRQWLVVRKQLPDMFGDGITAVSLQVIMLKYFLPTMGMDTQWQVPLFIGNMLMLCFTIGYQYGLVLTTDIDSTKLLHYHSSLLMTPRLAIVSYLLGAMVSFFVLLIPVGLIGGWFLSGTHALHGGIVASIVMSLLVVLFFSLMFTFLGIHFTPEIYMNNLWPRVLGPMFVLGCLLFTWARLHSFAPRLSYFFLLSPITYCVEGVRHALIGDPQYLSLPLCMTMVSLFCCVLMYLLQCAMQRRLDFVVVGRQKTC